MKLDTAVNMTLLSICHFNRSNAAKKSLSRKFGRVVIKWNVAHVLWKISATVTCRQHRQRTRREATSSSPVRIKMRHLYLLVPLLIVTLHSKTATAQRSEYNAMV